jgi:hypothetical protein
MVLLMLIVEIPLNPHLMLKMILMLWGRRCLWMLKEGSGALSFPPITLFLIRQILS